MLSKVMEEFEQRLARQNGQVGFDDCSSIVAIEALLLPFTIHSIHYAYGYENKLLTKF